MIFAKLIIKFDFINNFELKQLNHHLLLDNKPKFLSFCFSNNQIP